MRYYLLEWRTIRELSQPQLAEKSRVSRPTIREIEADPEKERQPKIIGKLSRALGIRPDDLKRPPDETIQKQPESPSSSANVIDDEIERVIENFKTLRYRGNLSEQEIDEVTKALIKDLIIEQRKNTRT